MNLEKRKKCHHIKNELESNEIAKRRAYQNMNVENEKAMAKRREIDILENERKALAFFTVRDSAGLISARGAIGAVVGTGKGIADLNDINEKIRNKTSELTFLLQTQNRHQREAERLENKTKNLRQRLDQMGCR